ncbi:TolC family protein [Sulfuriferula nivalis]|uniref:RND transporter n=1 Tax=Sulfuriferula nivalis TaxID=2675298 RepID=A0A809SIK7_9PROT|nr:TolC family protein [Sulfuriferula nivalis]BBP02060.1 RND transporter [Sulfuriferula nivalis]
MKTRFALSLFLLFATPIGAYAAPAAVAVSPAALTLAQAQALMLVHSRDLLAAQRNVEAAQATELSAAARPNPQISLNTTSINPHNFGAGSWSDKQIDTILRVDQVIERGDKRDLRIKTAQALTTASTADLADAQRQQLIALYNAFYDVAYAQGKIKLTADAANLALQGQKKAELRLAAGDIAASEVANIRVDTLRAQNDAEQAVADASNARIALAYMLGLDGSASAISVVSDWPQPASTLTPVDLTAIINRRADVQAAQARVEAARQYKELARSQRTRDISVGLQAEHYPGQTDNTMGLGISFPLLLGNNYEGDIRNAEVALSAAEDNLAKTQALATGELQRAQALLSSSQARLLRYQTDLLPSARRAMDAAEFGFANGAISAVDLLDARRTWRAIQLEALGAQSDYARAQHSWQTLTTQN